MELDALSGRLDDASREAEAALKDALNSDEMRQLKEYLGKIDREAIESVRDNLVLQLEEFLKLTEAQIGKLRPVLEDAFNQLGDMLDRLAEEGTRSFEKFKQEYEALNGDLRQKLSETLDGSQMELLETHRDELRDKINQALFQGQ